MAIRRRRLHDDAFLLTVAGSVIAVNAIFFPTSRLLAPMTFVWMFYAGITARCLARSPERSGAWAPASDGDRDPGDDVPRDTT
jgi:hypothetical protein